MLKRNRNIRGFTISGIIKDDSDIPRMKETFEKMLLDDMRDRGYVPVLDLETQFSVSYNQKKNHFIFYLVIFGVYLGKKQSREIEGFSGQGFLVRN